MTEKSKVDNAEETSHPEKQPSSSKAVAETPVQSSKGEEHINRQELINKALAFLASPQVRNEDIPAKRRFLSEKGLTDAEIDHLLRELPLHVPTVPPRTYPQPPPSNLPSLLLGVFRILTWITGASAALLLVYFRYILPKITLSFQARSALQNHHRHLLNKLTASLTSLKSIQNESFATLPTPKLPVLRSDSDFAQCVTVEDLKSRFEVEKKFIPPFTILRCVLSLSTSDKPTTEVIFKSIEQHFPHLNVSQNVEFQENLWQTLSTTPLFHEETSTSTETPTWTYIPPSPPSPTQYLASLTSLKSALPHQSLSMQSQDTPPPSSRFHHTLQAMTDLTGYLTTETYELPFNFRGSGISSGRIGRNSNTALANPQHEELRKEIRALKGLILNRRTFNIPRTPSGNASFAMHQQASASASVNSLTS